MRKPSKETIITAAVLALAIFAILSMRAQGIFGVQLYKTSAIPVFPGTFLYMSPTGGGSFSGITVNDPMTPSQAKAVPGMVHVYLLDGVYTSWTPSMSWTNPTSSPLTFETDGEPEGWLYITSDQIP